MQPDDLFRLVETSAHGESHDLDRLVDSSEDALYAAVGLRAREALTGKVTPGTKVDDLLRGGGGVGSNLFDSKLEVDALSRGDDERNLGKRIFRRWNQTLHDFACKPKAEDRDLQNKLLGAISMKAGGGTAIVAAVLAGYFLLSPPLAAVLSALLMKLIIVPAGQEACQAWGEALKRN